MKMNTRKTWLVLVAAFGLLAWSTAAFAGITAQCATCHTMHDSQNGDGDIGGAGQNAALLSSDCIACHTGTNNGSKPVVMSSSAPTTGNMTAGGSFYWVTAAGFGDAFGHNVAELGEGYDDTAIGMTPPGWDPAAAGAPDGTTVALGAGDWGANQLTCAGTYGCHGNHSTANTYEALDGAHHANAGGVTGAIGSGGLSAEVNPAVDSKPGAGFRFLQGIKGFEHANYEFEATPSSHNQYYGVHGGGDDQTISALCARCHGGFHGAGAGSAGAWIRHPTEYDLGATAVGSEYRSYNGDNSYSLEAPVASTNVSSALASVDVSANNGQAIVMCLSCHRAHGSEHDDLLRWDYSGMQANTNDAGFKGTGCFVCHTAKDGI